MHTHHKHKSAHTLTHIYAHTNTHTYTHPSPTSGDGGYLNILMFFIQFCNMLPRKSLLTPIVLC